MFLDFSKEVDSIHKKDKDQILLAYSLPKEIITTIIILYKNTKAMVCSRDENTDVFNIVVGVLLGYILVSYLFIHCVAYLLQTSIYQIKENGFTLKKSNQTITQKSMEDANNSDGLVLLGITLAQG